MKIILILLMLFVCFISFSEDGKYGYIIIKINNIDYDIFIDNNFAGKQNEKIKVSEGIHKLEIKINDEIIANHKIIIYENENFELSKLPKDDFKKVAEFSLNNNSYDKNPVNICYLIFSLFPVTNLLGYSFCGHPYILLGYSFYFPLLVLVPSLGSFITGVSLLSYDGWKYFIIQDNIIDRNYFIASIVCIGASYILNLIPLIVILFMDIPFFNVTKNEKKFSFIINYDFYKNNILFGLNLKL
jgi:hypothetical protein